MKKIFTLLAMMVLAIAANAQKFCWDNAEGSADYVATAGTIECLGGDKNDRLNYVNIALDVTYKTICINGKIGNMGDGTPNGTYMKVTFASPLAEGDVISMTAFRNKNNTTSGSSVALRFDNGAADVVLGGSDGFGFVNLNAAGDTPSATAPNTLTYTVTAAEAGATSMVMSRSKASTNLFITKLTVESAGPEPKEYTVNAHVEYYDGEIYEKDFLGQKVKVVFNYTDDFDGTCDITLPAAVAGPCTMEEQTIKDINFTYEDGAAGFWSDSPITLTVKYNGEPVELDAEITDGGVAADGSLILFITATDSKFGGSITVKYTGEGIEIPTAVKNAKAANAENKVSKFFKNGKVVIVKDGKMFNVAGAQM